MQQYTELSIEERAVIQVSLSMGISQRGIAKKLKRSPSTISREIKRNSVNSEYTAQTAQQIRCRKRQVCRPSKKLVPGEELFEIVIEMLQDKFSPEQIAGHLRNMNTTNDKDRYVCRETIYNAIYALPVGELRFVCVKAKALASHVQVVLIVVTRSPIWSAFMCVPLKSKTAWFQGTGRVI